MAAICSLYQGPPNGFEAGTGNIADAVGLGELIEVGKALNADGFAVHAGHRCAQPILRRMGVEATVRPSFAFYSTFDEIDMFLDAVRRIAEGGTNTG